MQYIQLLVKHIVALPILLFFMVTLFIATPGETKTTKEQCENWLKAVKENNIKESVSIARQLVPQKKYTIKEGHILLAKQNGISSGYFSAPFNYWDFELWRDAYFWQQKSREFRDIKEMFSGVRQRIERKELKIGEFERAPWPYRIWERKFGVCDRQAWVLCEIAYQKGWEGQIVYLWDPDKKTSPHTYCELRKEDKVWFADPYHNELHPVSSEEMLEKFDQLGLWNGYPDLCKILPHSLFWTPSYPQDYCPKNQELYNILKTHLNERCPRFGIPPDERLQKYRELSLRSVVELPKFKMDLWFYPFRLLNEDIKRYCLMYGVSYISR